MGWPKKIQRLQWEDLDPIGKNSEVREQLRNINEYILQPFWNEAIESPNAKLYIQYVKRQARGKYGPLPWWLKLVLKETASYNIDLSRVNYAEGIDTLQSGNAITFGYSIHFPRKLNLDRMGPDRNDVHWMLHELEHVVQYKTTGVVNAFVIKYVAQAVTSIGSWKVHINNIHDNMAIERDAESKADNLLDTVLQELCDLSLDRPTVPGKNLGPRLEMSNQRMYEGDYLQSNNGLYWFICQGDGNVVLYGPKNSVVWSSSTDGMGHPPYRIVGQDDRNVVQYDRDNMAIWRADTPENGHPGCFLVLQNDRNLVLYQPGQPMKAIWHTRTYL
ncbi:hypothetical protein BJX65DRAFT_243945 [Aspergillus insuetus]